MIINTGQVLFIHRDTSSLFHLVHRSTERPSLFFYLRVGGIIVLSKKIKFFSVSFTRIQLCSIELVENCLLISLIKHIHIYLLCNISKLNQHVGIYTWSNIAFRCSSSSSIHPVGIERRERERERETRMMNVLLCSHSMVVLLLRWVVSWILPMRENKVDHRRLRFIFLSRHHSKTKLTED